MLLTIRDVSSILHVSESTVHRWIHEKGLPIQQVNGHSRLAPAHLLEWLADHPIPIKSNVFPMNGSAAGLRLDDALRAGGIHSDVPGSDKAAFLQAIVERLPAIPGMPAEDLLALLRSREASGTTHLGEGIALPHPRFPLIHTTMAPMLALCRPQTPVAWTADGKLVHTAFVLICPTVRLHLRLLARLMFALNAPSFQSALKRKASSAETLAAAREFEAATAVKETPAS